MKKEEKEETALEIVQRVIDTDLTKVLEMVFADKKLAVEQKSRIISTMDSALSMLRIIRAQLET